MNYKELGLKCGLEIHQQLEGKKLFCNCPTTIRDDEADFVDLVVMRLKAQGYTLRIAYDGAQALKSIKEFAPDLILLDVIMRDMSGQDVVKWIRADNHFRHTPIIFLTAMSEGDIAPGKVGGEKFPLIQKPVSIEDLTQSIEASLGRVR